MAALTGCGFKGTHVDLILHNGLILTLDGESSQAQAVAVHQGRVVEVGPERGILNQYSADQEVDLMGAVLVPGLMDAHAHFVGFAKSLATADLRGTDSESEVLRLAREQGQRHAGFLCGRP